MFNYSIQSINISIGGRLKQAVIAVFALINNVDLVGFGINEHKEIVADHVHLKDSLLNADGLDENLLFADNLVVILRLLSLLSGKLSGKSVKRTASFQGAFYSCGSDA